MKENPKTMPHIIVNRIERILQSETCPPKYFVLNTSLVFIAVLRVKYSNNWISHVTCIFIIDVSAVFHETERGRECKGKSHKKEWSTSFSPAAWETFARASIGGIEATRGGFKRSREKGYIIYINKCGIHTGMSLLLARDFFFSHRLQHIRVYYIHHVYTQWQCDWSKYTHTHTRI